ncbi:unnamed protein product [Nippostrongylus brasiliensis]|uniref:SPECC1 n=1 Tax=Nippostrongylus brasiliensis TaxID=27835 RepID=A0A158R1B4_NIPBR|nr:unnamed protein product [Nippostrongylus brasiliensis]
MDRRTPTSRQVTLSSRNSVTQSGGPVRSRITSTPLSADPPRKANSSRLNTVSIRRRAASGSALNRIPVPPKSATLCKLSHLNNASPAPGFEKTEKSQKRSPLVKIAVTC